MTIDRVPAATGGSYSDAVSVHGPGRWVHVSGQVAFGPDGTVSGSMYEQANGCFDHIERALTAVGGSLADVVRITTFVTDLADYAGFGQARAERFGQAPRPVPQSRWPDSSSARRSRSTPSPARAAFAGTAGLAAANGTLEAMVAPLAVELAPLRVNAVSPGVIDTHWWNAMPDDQRKTYFDAVAAVTPVRRVGKPEDVADAILYLAGAGYITGTVLECAGGSNLTAAALAS